MRSTNRERARARARTCAHAERTRRTRRPVLRAHERARTRAARARRRRRRTPATEELLSQLTAAIFPPPNTTEAVVKVERAADTRNTFQCNPPDMEAVSMCTRATFKHTFVWKPHEHS